MVRLCCRPHHLVHKRRVNDAFGRSRSVRKKDANTSKEGDQDGDEDKNVGLAAREG
jgi:hypothetical protein